MTVRDFLNAINDNVNIVVKQVPISRIDSSCNYVERQAGERSVLLTSNQNYLDYDVINTKCNDNTITVFCKASPAQEMKVIVAMYSCGM
jgi:hypothetical protein